MTYVFGRAIKRFGFTMSEILIAMTVLAIVVVLTIPFLVKNYQKEQFAQLTKQTFSILNNAKIKAEIDYGPMENWAIKNNDTLDFINKYMKPYVIITKVNMNYDNHRTQFIDGAYFAQNAYDAFNYRTYKFYLQNGVQIAVKSCSIGGSDSDFCEVWADVNGPKKPNILGKDIHIFRYYFKPTYVHSKNLAGKFYVAHIFSATGESLKTHCLNNSLNRAGACTAVLLKNGWKYPNWFPW